MAKINLVRGFTIRKRLRTILNKITDELSTAQTFVKVSITYPDGKVIDSPDSAFSYRGNSLLETYRILEKGNEYMITLNNILDNSNNKCARKIINELESEKSKVDMLKHLALNKKRFSETVSTYDSNYMIEGNKSNGGIITTKYKLTDDFDWAKASNECRKKIVLLEDSLSEVNSKTFFEVPDEILDFIEENI